MAALAHDFDREANRGVRLGVVGCAVAIGGNLRIVEFREVLADIGMGRQTIVAAVDLGDGERDALACRGRQRALINAPDRSR